MHVTPLIGVIPFGLGAFGAGPLLKVLFPLPIPPGVHLVPLGAAGPQLRDQFLQRRTFVPIQ